MVKKPFKYTHVGRLPEDWDCLQAIEVIDEISMGPFGSDITVSNFVSSGVPVLNGYNVSQIMLIDKFQNFVTPKKAKELKKAVAHRGDIIVTHRGTIGQVSYIPDSSAYSEYVISQSQFRVHFNDKRVNSHFLVSYLLSPIGQKYLLETKGHTGVPALAQPTTNFRRLWIPLPEIAEQVAIAEALSNVDSLISSLQKLIEKKKAIKQGAMQELLTSKKRLPGFSTEWSQATFGDLFDFLPTNAFTRDQMTDTGTIQNVHYGDILTKYGACLDMANTDVPYLLETVSVRKYSESSYAREGDVIIADTAEDSTVGKCVELVNVHGKVLSGQHTMLCRPKATFAPKFLGYYMNAECFHNQMLPFITGIKVSSISKANISTLVLKYPTLVEEQQAIAQVFSDMDNEIAQLEKKLAKYQQIKQGMMQELLTGRIRLVDADRKEQPKTQILQERQPAHNQHFDDAVMIAGIVNAFYSEKYPLGRKKVQKLLYLVRRKEQADISAFHKKAAGPYADEVRYKGGEPIAQKNKYIQVKRSEKGSRFEKGVQMQQAMAYLQEWGKQADIDWLVSQFQYTSVDELELLATVDMAICDLRREGKEISVASIKGLIRSNKEWRDKLKKTYFRDSDIQRAIKKCQDLFES